MRPNVKSMTPDEEDRLMLESRDQYIADVIERSKRWTGPTEYVAISHEKFVGLLIILEDEYVVLSLDRSLPADRSLKSLGVFRRSPLVVRGSSPLIRSRLAATIEL